MATRTQATAAAVIQDARCFGTARVTRFTVTYTWRSSSLVRSSCTLSMCDIRISTTSLPRREKRQGVLGRNCLPFTSLALQLVIKRRRNVKKEINENNKI
ncbi:hypothetical protein AVEN_69480-1 [Araneus ventricosus]|uniref:Uncharacterized protein n=1 Tax=Araneus ventricosus TaxID=182803 RepID=A0A4Y2L2H7_ARAVE|nr:hypothetical protein AVEN_69480-1 [Araneus ventricosus]